MSQILQGFKVLEAVATEQPIGVSPLARSLDMPKTTVFRTLKSLEQAGWIRQKSHGNSVLWTLTAAPLILGKYVAQDNHLKDFALPVMARLRDEWKEAVHLAAPEGTGIVVLAQVEAHQTVRIQWNLGEVSSAQVSANGRALLAFSQGAQRDRLYPDSFDKYTPRTITSPDEYNAELQRIRERGYAIVHGEQREDISSVAAPILQGDDNPVASISVFIPSYRFPHEKEAELGEAVKQAASEVAERLRGQGGS